MTSSAIIQRYRDAQSRVKAVIEPLSDHDYRTQFHHELSALGWHLAHCLYIENFWLREELSGDDSLTKGLDKHFIPEKSYKPDRGGKLPELNKLLEVADKYHADNIALLDKLTPKENKKYLLNDDYLQNFIIQHYDQHYESMQMALQQRAINQDYSHYQVKNILYADKGAIKTHIILKNKYSIGSNESVCYDNEQPQHTKTLERFSISINPVSNSQYLAFMQDDGYLKQNLWSDEGWQWLQDQSNTKEIISPEHWQQDENKYWFGINIDGPQDLVPDAAVYGINHYEACAFAKWSGARLAHEHEWEVAHQQGLLKNTGCAWEWCNNRFSAYTGFKAFPYDGYSTPWFEQTHYVLKGASEHTQANIKRPSFRNFFGPDKRHVFAGCRLVYNQ